MPTISSIILKSANAIIIYILTLSFYYTSFNIPINIFFLIIACDCNSYIDVINNTFTIFLLYIFPNYNMLHKFSRLTEEVR